MYSCTTEFDDSYRPFYVFRMRNRRKPIGYIPAGVDVVYMRKRLHTVEAVQKIHEVFIMNGRLPKDMHSMEEWYDARGDLNKKLFYKFMKGLKET